jgi:O-antigen ligase
VPRRLVPTASTILLSPARATPGSCDSRGTHEQRTRHFKADRGLDELRALKRERRSMTALAIALRTPLRRVTHQGGLLVYVVLVVTSIGLGAGAAGEGGMLAQASLLLLGLICLGIALSIRPDVLFVGWIFAAPFLQTPFEGGLGKFLNQVVYLVPPLLLIGTALARRSQGRLIPLDVLPALYAVYVLVSALLISSEPASIGALARPVYVTILLGIVIYYFLIFGPLTDNVVVRFAGALIWSGVILSVMVIVEGFTGWNLWGDTTLQADEIVRAVATLANPAAVGIFLGLVVVLSMAILLWDGPRQLKRPALAAIVLAIPALFFTYTRGPVLATAVVGVAMVLVANRARWPSVVVLILVGASLFAAWDRLSSTSIYEKRLSVSDTAQTRLLIQEWSFRLIEQKPVAGWGFGSFDRVKNEAEFDRSYRGIPEIYGRSNTSHNTFLTVLVELGFLGLILLLLPWAVVGWRAAKAARARPELRWILGAVAAFLVVYVISAGTFDSRFFSFVLALPWIALGVARRVMDQKSPA